MTPERGNLYRTLAMWVISHKCAELPVSAVVNLLWHSDCRIEGDNAYTRFIGNIDLAMDCYRTDEQLRNWLRRDLAKLTWALEHRCLQPETDALETEGRVRRIFTNLRNWFAGRSTSDGQQNDSDQFRDPVVGPAEEAPPHVPFDCYVSFVRWWVEGWISFAECEGIVHHLTQLDAEVGSRSWSPLEQRFQNAVDAALSQPDDHESALRACEAALRMLESEPETGHTPTV